VSRGGLALLGVGLEGVDSEGDEGGVSLLGVDDVASCGGCDVVCVVWEASVALATVF